MAYAQGSVVLAPATFKGGIRPYLIVSSRNRPFFGDRYSVAVITSTERDAAVQLTGASLTEGELKTYPQLRQSVVAACLSRPRDYTRNRRNTTPFTAWIRAVTPGNSPPFKRMP